MKFNGTIFSKPQQDQLKEVIGKDLEAVIKKVEESSQNSLRYLGNWDTNTTYSPNDLVTDGAGIYLATKNVKDIQPKYDNDGRWIHFGNQYIAYSAQNSVAKGDDLLNRLNEGVLQGSGSVYPQSLGKYQTCYPVVGAVIEDVDVNFSVDFGESWYRLNGFVIANNEVIEYFIQYDAKASTATALKRNSTGTVAFTEPDVYSLNVRALTD